MKDAEEAVKTDDKATIEARTEALAEASHKLAEKMYQQAAAEQPAGEASAAGGASAPGGDAGKKDDGNVVDAEFEEVKEKKG